MSQYMVPPPRLAIEPADSWNRCAVTCGKRESDRFPKFSMAIRLISPEAVSHRPGAWPRCYALTPKTRSVKNPSSPSRPRDFHTAIRSGDLNRRAALSHIEGHLFVQTSLNSHGEIGLYAAVDGGRLKMSRVVRWNV